MKKKDKTMSHYTLKVKFKSDETKQKYDETGKFVWRAGDSSLDLINATGEKIFLAPFETKIVDSGIACQLQMIEDNNDESTNYEIQVRPRSGWSSKGLHVNFGTVDHGYTGWIGVSMYNATEHEIEIEPWSRIAQIVVQPVIKPVIQVVDELNETERSNKGFGSSGV